MKKLSVFCSLVILTSVGVVSDASARSFYLGRLPSVSPQGAGCGTCHIADAGRGPRNPFGVAFEDNGLQWNKALADLDSDGDTFTNGVELGDTTGTVMGGGATFVSHPGDMTSTPPVMNCGNGTVDNGEDCDGAQLNGKTCANLGQGFDGGTLSCKADCKFDTSACTMPVPCGNGMIDNGEQCDGAELGGKTCASINQGFDGGALSCKADCSLDTSACTMPVPMDMGMDMAPVEDMRAPVDMKMEQDMAVEQDMTTNTPDMAVTQDMGSSSQDMGITPTPTTPKTQEDEGCSQSGKRGLGDAGLGLLLLGFFGVRRARRRV